MSHDAALRMAVEYHRERVGYGGTSREMHERALTAIEAAADHLARITAERDEARALKVPPSVDELLAAKMAGATARAERDALAVQVTTLREAQAKAWEDAAEYVETSDRKTIGHVDPDRAIDFHLRDFAKRLRQRAADLRAGR